MPSPVIAAGGAGAHYGLIATHLIKFDESLSPDARAALPIQPSHGVDGHGHGNTRCLHHMRRD